ncbi:hypothetical protein ACFQQB_46715 [Nonomuraea rubra]|uniref:hypothetical protein n=1 Tax=Nonomuraea rubra TaxID=46180 RepID=UPI00361A0DBC
MPGDLYLLAGRYRLIERLGQGGAGTVWRAIDDMLDRQVAVKQVRVPEGLGPRSGRSSPTGPCTRRGPRGGCATRRSCSCTTWSWRATSPGSSWT